MLKTVFRWMLTACGVVFGVVLGTQALTINGSTQIKYINDHGFFSVGFVILVTILIGIIFYFISPYITNLIFKAMEYVEKSLQKTSSVDILFGTVGGILGIVIGVLFGVLLSDNIYLRIISVILTVALAILGIQTAIKKKEEIISLITGFKKVSNKEKKKPIIREYAKILDTSVIIDGRIFDICQTGFIEGPLVIPNFVLDELRHISDSSDDLKRQRGRRGLDIINKIQKELSIEVQITDKDFPEILEVDSKLLKLTQFLNGKILTNDYNLNKVAEVQGVMVLNINELANAVKTVLIPGEEMTMQIIKEGKESNQGIGYLEDGTMIVVENGRKYIGEFIAVGVTSVLQTAAGRMIFASKKNN